MKRVLLLTGKKANEVVSKQKDLLNNFYGDELVFEVKELPVEVAAFITKDMIKNLSLEKFDYVIVSGASSYDFSDLPKTYKGPKNAFDIKKYLKKGIENLSPSKSADELIELEKNQKNQFKEFEEKASFDMKIGDLEIGKEKPMRISAEIVDATEKTEEEIKNTIKNYEEQGAELIDLGIPIATDNYELVRTVEIAKKFTNKPLSVDTVNPELIKKSIDLGIDLVLSVTPKNIEEVEDYLSGVNCVVAAKDKLKNTVERAKEAGANPIADPILDPPNKGLVDSLIRYYKYKNNEQDSPLFFGIGNVTEMIDADSNGVNAIMSSIASELNVSILFTAQASSKTKYGVRELKKASRLNFLAKNKRTTPKDLGIDLLYLKDKNRKEVEPKVGGRTIVAEEEKGYEEDEGYFEIGIDREEKKILAVFYENKKQEPTLTIKGETAKSITDKIKDLKIIKKENHFFYLGRELKKAEIALKTGKNYLQGTYLF